MKCLFLHDGIFPFTGEYCTWSVILIRTGFVSTVFSYLYFIQNVSGIDVNRYWPGSDVMLTSYWTIAQVMMNATLNRIWHVMELRRTVTWLWTTCVICLFLFILCLLSRKAHPEQISGISRIYCNLFMTVQNLHELFRYNSGNLWSVSEKSSLPSPATALSFKGPGFRHLPLRKCLRNELR